MPAVVISGESMREMIFLMMEQLVLSPNLSLVKLWIPFAERIKDTL